MVSFFLRVNEKEIVRLCIIGEFLVFVVFFDKKCGCENWIVVFVLDGLYFVWL